MLKICYDSYLIVAGDFNNHEKPLNNLFSLNDQRITTYARKFKDIKREFTTDWIMINKKDINFKINIEEKDCSDHKLLNC